MRHILLAVICGFIANIVLAQDIHVLPSDPVVKSGYLPNGTAYFIASNSSMKGMADFAVVQKTGASTIPGVSRDRIESTAREALTSRIHEQAPSAQDYFLSAGVIPGRNGFFEVSENATTFRFSDVNLLQGKEVLDSSLWVLMGIIGKGMRDADRGLSQWYVPSDQAVIIAGDVNNDKVLEKLKALSYATPSSVSMPKPGYVWKEQNGVVVRTSVDDSRNLSVVTVSWRLQRTPQEYMNTVQPVVYGRYMRELGILAQTQIESLLKNADVPVAFVEADYIDGVRTLEDEIFVVTVAVGSQNWAEAVASVASVMSSLDSGKIDVADLEKAECRFFDDSEMNCNSRVSNEGYVDRCISAFMYNASLASEKDILAFHTSRELNENVELGIFRSIVSASVSDNKNLTIECCTADTSITECGVRNVFERAWNSPSDNVPLEMTVPAFYGLQEKVKIKSPKKEHTSGGVIWTVSNGLKVMFRNVPSNGKVYYSLSLNGGYGSIEDLQSGEGAYLSDYLDLCRIGGAKADVFKDVIRKQGMTMDMQVDLSKMSIEGRIPKDRVDILLKALLTVLNDSEIDKDEFRYYAESQELKLESLRGGVQERISIMDGIICPDYKFTSIKKKGVLTDGFVERAEKYMSAQAAKVNDGALILVGDIDEEKLKEALVNYAGGFKTSGTLFSRPVVNYQPVSGKAIYTFGGEGNSVDIIMSVPMTYTADNYYASDLAVMALKKEIARRTAGTGMTLSIKHKCLRYPQGRLNLLVSMEGASMAELSQIRAVLSDMGSLEVSDLAFDSYKSFLKQQLSMKRETPEYWLGTIAMRHLDGKDFTTGADQKIDAVTKARIQEILASFKDGLRVEYIVNKK